MTQFSSDGFDLDAVTANDSDEVVYEVGGTATVLKTQSQESATNRSDSDGDDSHVSKAEKFKQQGNECFKQGKYLEAYDMYTEAIEACSSALSGEEILRLRDEFVEDQRAQAVNRQRLEEENRRAKADNQDAKQEIQPTPQQEFELPTQPQGANLAIFYCNRAATLVHMERNEDAIKDCDVAILLNPKYVKGFVRRCMANEKLGNTEEALRDAKKALELDPSNATLRKTAARLEKLEKERIEKLKAETMDKLKDLGNSLLGNFGLSLDNFQAVQDPATGSYSISFNQNGGK